MPGDSAQPSGSHRSTRGWLRAAIAVALAGLACASAQSAEIGQRARLHEVVIEGFQFGPRSLEITLGDTVVWVNRDPFDHSATSLRKAFDSGVLAKDEKSVFIAGERGDYDYRCALHPVMEGKIVVR